jgi:hypothetical protein
MLTEELHAEVPDRDRGLVSRAGLGEPQPHMALMLRGDLECALFSVVGPGAPAPAVLVGIHGRVTDAILPDPFDDVRHFACPLAPPTGPPWLANWLARAAARALHWATLHTKNPGSPGLLILIITRSIELMRICGPGCRGFESHRSPHRLEPVTCGCPVLGAEWKSSSISACSRSPWPRYGISGAFRYQRRLTRVYAHPKR